MQYRILALLLPFFLLTCGTTEQKADEISEQQRVYDAWDAVASSPAATAAADSIPVAYTVKSVAEAPADFATMMGRWVASYDEAEIIHFLPGKYASYYADQKVVEEQVTYYEVCPTSCVSDRTAPPPCFVLGADQGQMCFSILIQTEDQLQLRMLGQEGGVLTYFREIP